jgi:hypothetical protein
MVTEEAEWERILGTFKNLRETIELRGTRFYHARFLPPNQNTALVCAKSEAQRLAPDVTADPLQRTKATEALSSGQFFFGLGPCRTHARVHSFGITAHTNGASMTNSSSVSDTWTRGTFLRVLPVLWHATKF